MKEVRWRNIFTVAALVSMTINAAVHYGDKADINDGTMMAILLALLAIAWRDK